MIFSGIWHDIFMDRTYDTVRGFYERNVKKN